ncbi:UPF0149 family protein [Chitinolyticbacter albus]|uniref:UPF0149 family protein n=1 Tax=Chitinolyticbacter albus TaxID=2961951 RepID=UPI00210A11BA|nr:UPF0149 family protein [Chitinolyticbacter albus]
MASKGFAKTTVAPLSEAELDELAEFLTSDAVSDECMDLSMLHGFLTAILVGPQEPLPDAWLPQVWGEAGQKPKFESTTQQTRIEDLVLRLYNQLADELTSEPPEFAPMVYVDEETGRDIVQQWCYGFTLGTSLVQEAWQSMFDDEDGAQLLAPIFDCADEEAREEIAAEGEDLAEFEHELASILPEAIPEIRSWWHTSQPVAPAPRQGRQKH